MWRAINGTNLEVSKLKLKTLNVGAFATNPQFVAVEPFGANFLDCLFENRRAFVFPDIYPSSFVGIVVVSTTHNI
jgi:hypothetical protein